MLQCTTEIISSFFVRTKAGPENPIPRELFNWHISQYQNMIVYPREIRKTAHGEDFIVLQCVHYG